MNQARIREAPVMTGQWALTSESAGSYRIALRRWPRESGLSLRSEASPGQPVPGLEAYRETAGRPLSIVSATIRIAGIEVAMDLPDDRQEAVFELELPTGDFYLQADFRLESQETVGAYYAYIEKL